MQEFNHIVKSKTGMHMRPAMEIYHLSHQYQCDIVMTCQTTTLHAKMLMDVMKLPAHQGDCIHVEITGHQEMLVERKLKSICDKML